MSVPNPFHKQYPVTSVTWTEIIVPVDCSYYLLKNLDGTPFRLRTDVNDVTTEDIVPVSDAIIAPVGNSEANVVRYKEGDSLGFAQSVSGTGPLLGKFVR